MLHVTHIIYVSLRKVNSYLLSQIVDYVQQDNQLSVQKGSLPGLAPSYSQLLNGDVLFVAVEFLGCHVYL